MWSKLVPILEWPAESPDLSPIENIKKILKRKVAQRRPRNIYQLKDLSAVGMEKNSYKHIKLFNVIHAETSC